MAENVDLTESGMTIPSDSEHYSASNNDDLSPSPSSNNTPALVVYSPPTIWGLLRGAAINLLLPFVNGLMLGFGELFAHEAAFRLGWGGTKVRFIIPLSSYRIKFQRLEANEIYCRFSQHHAAQERLGPESRFGMTQLREDGEMVNFRILQAWSKREDKHDEHHCGVWRWKI